MMENAPKSSYIRLEAPLFSGFGSPIFHSLRRKPQNPYQPRHTAVVLTLTQPCLLILMDELDPFPSRFKFNA